VYIDAAMKYLAIRKEDDRDGAMVDETSVDEMSEDMGDKMRTEDKIRAGERGSDKMRASESQSTLFFLPLSSFSVITLTLLHCLHLILQDCIKHSSSLY